MKTLFWTGSYCASTRHGQAAIWRWWNYYQQHRGALGITHWCVINDGPENLPVEEIVYRQNADQPLGLLKEKLLNLIYFSAHLGFNGVFDRSGFWRNIRTAIRICQEQDFDRFVLVEYDSVILSPDMLFEVGATKDGLTCYWCPTYGIPETSFVICGRNMFNRVEEQANAIMNKSNPGEADRFEVAMDWTEIRKHRKGDRYPEVGRTVPMDAEYCCQLPINAQLVWGRVIDVI